MPQIDMMHRLQERCRFLGQPSDTAEGLMLLEKPIRIFITFNESLTLQAVTTYRNMCLPLFANGPHRCRGRQTHLSQPSGTRDDVYRTANSSMFLLSKKFLCLVPTRGGVLDFSSDVRFGLLLEIEILTACRNLIRSIVYTPLAASKAKNNIHATIMANDTIPKMTWVLIPLCTNASFRAYLATVLT